MSLYHKIVSSSSTPVCVASVANRLYSSSTTTNTTNNALDSKLFSAPVHRNISKLASDYRFSCSVPDTSGIKHPSLSSWATYDYTKPSKNHQLSHFVDGKWLSADQGDVIPDPLTEGHLYTLPKFRNQDRDMFINQLNNVPRSGMFNILKNPEEYREMGDVLSAAARRLHDPVVYDYFVKLIQLTMPKSRVQAKGEVTILRLFLENFSADRPRMLMRGFNQAGDRMGQLSQGFRYPFGATAVIAPFNFPLEIIGMQFLGSCLVGNFCFLKPSAQVSVVMEEFLRLMLDCGFNPNLVSLFQGHGPDAEQVLANSRVHVTQFTGSTRVGEHLAKVLKGKVKLEDAGFDVKILGPDAKAKGTPDFNYITWQCDQDAYAISGQKCSAQSFLAVHRNWIQMDTGCISTCSFTQSLKERASKRSLDDLTLGPIIGHTPQACKDHVSEVMKLEGARMLFGGNVLDNAGPGLASKEAAEVRDSNTKLSVKIHPKYAYMEPTAVFVPFKTLKSLPKDHMVFTELFGPLQIVTVYGNEDYSALTDLVDGFSHHLTMGLVTQDDDFATHVLGNTIHGVTYCGNRARTTGAPQNHWFGPGGDVRGAGIGTPEAILSTWTFHREIVRDNGPSANITMNQS